MIALSDGLIAERKLTLLMVTHEMGDARALDARVVQCRGGKLIS